MLSTPHPHGRSRGRLGVALVSVLALLAFACFPVLAQAENVYEVEETQIPNQVEKSPSNSGHKNTHSGGSSPEAQNSTSPEGGGGEGGGESPESESHKGASAGGGNPSNPGGGGPAQGRQGEGGGNAKGQPGSGGAQKIEPVSSTTDEGSSSPLVPILIAVAVLAAISVGAVIVRQRRQRAGGQVSPKAS